MSFFSKALLTTAATTAVITGSFYLIVTLFPNAFGNYFSIKHIRLVGEMGEISPALVQKSMSQTVQGNLFTVDAQAVKTALEALPWIREARIRRIWPDTLEVSFAQHVPFALWEEDKIVSDRGAVFEIGSEDAAVVANLPEFYGPRESIPEMVERYKRWVALLEKMNNNALVTEVSVSERGTWSVALKGGDIPDLRIILGVEAKDNPLDARFEEVVLQYPEVCAVMGSAPKKIDARYRRAFAATVPGDDASEVP